MNAPAPYTQAERRAARQVARGLWVLSVLGLLVIVLSLWGCSAKYWGGEATGENPGIHYRGASLWNPPEFRMTSNGRLGAELVDVRYDPNGPFHMRFEKPLLDQNASDVMREEVAKLAGIAQVQHEQAVYWQALGAAVRSWIEEVAPLINVLALAKMHRTESGLSLTLPNGVTLGGQRIETPPDLTGYLQLLQQMQPQVPPTSQPASP